MRNIFVKCSYCKAVLYSNITIQFYMISIYVKLIHHLLFYNMFTYYPVFNLLHTITTVFYFYGKPLNYSRVLVNVVFRWDDIREQMRESTTMDNKQYEYDNTTTPVCNAFFETLESSPRLTALWRMFKPFVRSLI